MTHDPRHNTDFCTLTRTTWTGVSKVISFSIPGSLPVNITVYYPVPTLLSLTDGFLVYLPTVFWEGSLLLQV